jgi:hypothetical protein
MKRWPVIRHIRALYWAWRAERHYRSWQKAGDFGHLAERDYQHARRIWWGEA